MLPRAGSGARTTIAIGSCAAQFGPIFDEIAARRPDAFVWQGDLNYPDTVGPLAQTVPGYAGIWRDFLANPRLAPILERSLFAAQRDDHDYGVQDANSTNLVPWGLAPWEALMSRARTTASPPGWPTSGCSTSAATRRDPDGAGHAGQDAARRGSARVADAHAGGVAGAVQGDLLSRARSRRLPANARDGSWAAGFTAERELLLAHIRERVAGRTLFVTGDTHWTMVYDRDGLFEARPCPLGIPTPNDITLTQPQAAEDARGEPGVAYADDDRGHVALIEVSGERGRRPARPHAGARGRRGAVQDPVRAPALGAQAVALADAGRPGPATTPRSCSRPISASLSPSTSASTSSVCSPSSGARRTGTALERAEVERRARHQVGADAGLLDLARTSGSPVEQRGSSSTSSMNVW